MRRTAISSTRDALAHLQLADPADVARMGRDHLYVAFTYAWMYTDPEYDLTVIPFVQPVSGNSYQALHPTGSYYENNAYPVRAAKDAGAIITAGSDAPVDTRDPRPFINMATAVTRHLPAQPALGPQHRITLAGGRRGLHHQRRPDAQHRRRCRLARGRQVGRFRRARSRHLRPRRRGPS